MRHGHTADPAAKYRWRHELVASLQPRARPARVSEQCSAQYADRTLITDRR